MAKEVIERRKLGSNREKINSLMQAKWKLEQARELVEKDFRLLGVRISFDLDLIESHLEELTENV